MFDARQINDAAFSYYGRLERVKGYVDRHYSEDLCLQKLAAVAGLEEKYFSTFFRRKIGVRLCDWLTYVRVTRAIALMKSRNYSITYLGSCVGFNDLRTFERAFKRCTNHTPVAFKKLLRPS